MSRWKFDTCDQPIKPCASKMHVLEDCTLLIARGIS